jgi:hypothetical protein
MRQRPFGEINLSQLYGNAQLTGKERIFEAITVSKTDLEGKTGWHALKA